MTRSTANQCIRRWPSLAAKAWLVDFLERVRGNANIQAVVAIGSAVRDGVQSDDLDILVLCRFARDFSERAPIEVDVRVFETQSVDERIKEGNDLLGWAVTFGRVLYDPKRTWYHVVKKWRGRVPLPNPKVARNRAIVTRRRMQEMREMGDEDAAVELELAYLSHSARAELADEGIYPASRPELPSQLAEVGAHVLAARIRDALDARAKMRKQIVGGGAPR